MKQRRPSAASFKHITARSMIRILIENRRQSVKISAAGVKPLLFFPAVRPGYRSHDFTISRHHDITTSRYHDLTSHDFTTSRSPTAEQRSHDFTISRNTVANAKKRQLSPLSALRTPLSVSLGTAQHAKRPHAFAPPTSSGICAAVVFGRANTRPSPPSAGKIPFSASSARCLSTEITYSCWSLL